MITSPHYKAKTGPLSLYLSFSSPNFSRLLNVFVPVAFLAQLYNLFNIVKMNTVRSFWLGWGSLCVAGGAAYVFAKRSINADRQSRLEEQRKKKSMIESLEYSDNVPTRPLSSATMGGTAGAANGGPARTDTAGSPSQESSSDPAPTRHAPTTEGQRVFEKSKYESSVPYKSPKGDRFS